MATRALKYRNIEGLRASIEEARLLASRNGRFGHALVVLSALSAIGVALLAYASGDKSSLDDVRPVLIGLAAIPSAIAIAEKALRPAAWEAWYARKALALEAIWRHAHHAPSTPEAPDLSAEQVDWWNRVDEAFEQTRPSWGPRDASDLEASKGSAAVS